MSANTTSGFEAVQNMECNVEAPVNVANTIARIRDDYDDLVTGVVREVIQNSVDGRVQNTDREGSTIEGVDGLEIQFKITKKADGRDKMEIVDNAGGMPKDVLENNLVGVDNPSEDKENGEMNGAYGRGFYVIISAGSGESYVQTRHVNRAYSIGVDGRGMITPVAEDDASAFPEDEDGTYILCTDLHESTMDNLADFSYFEDRVLDSFWYLFSNFDVTVSHTVVEEDGSTVENQITESPINLSEYESDIIHHQDEFPEITVGGRSGQVTEMTLYHTKNMSEDELEYIDGICALKGSPETGPVMKVMSYTPHLPSITDDKMIGVADVTDMCPQYESNDHFGLYYQAKDRCGWMDEAREAHEQNFSNEIKTEEEQQIEGDVMEVVNETLSMSDENIESLFGGGVNSSNTDQSSSSSTTTNNPSTARVKCMVGGRGKEFDVGTEVPFRVTVSNPQSSTISNWRIEASLTGPVEAPYAESVRVNPGSSETFDLGTDILPQEGEYEFVVELYDQESSGSFGFGEDSDEPLSKSSYTFYVGDVEREQSVSVSSSSSGTPELLTDIMLSADPDRNWRASVEASRDGFTASINIGRVEMREIAKGGASKKVVKQRTRKATEWVLEEVAAEIAKQTVDSTEYEDVRMEQREIADELTQVYQNNL